VITNERQYKITKAQLAKLLEGIEQFDLEAVAAITGSKTLAKAELEAIKSEAEILENQVLEYERLKSGAITYFEASSLEELPSVLIRARIAQQLSQKELGELIGLKEQQIQRYEAEEYASASLRRLKEIANALKLNISEIAEIKPISSLASESTKQEALQWNRFPIKEMYKRGWFEGFTGSLTDLMDEAEELVREFISSAHKKPSMALHRKLIRSGVELDPYALLAWECRVLALAAREKKERTYQAKLLTLQWIDNLRKLSRLEDGPAQAKIMLAEAGISLIIEPHLASTYLDGAAMLLDADSPVIGMTLRYDRLDNFWFVLFHELIHIMRHLKKGKIENIFDDLDADSRNEIEIEADTLSGEALISSKEWDQALPRFIQSEETIKIFASQLQISPAIVAGRIRHDSKNYTIFNDLLGQGEVRKHFPVKFGR
jgi:HTH-type transcriptional regulator/antitoxin HigA